MKEEELLDDFGIPKAYEMVRACERLVEEDRVGDGLEYYSISSMIREETTGYLLPDEAMQLQDYVLEQDFEEAYDFLDENWEESVRDVVGDEHDISEWEPSKPFQ